MIIRKKSVFNNLTYKIYLHFGCVRIHVGVCDDQQGETQPTSSSGPY